MDAATDWVVSGGRYALDFDGTNDYAAISRGVAVTSSVVSLSCWIRIPDLSASMTFPRLIDISDGTNSVQVVLDLGFGGSDQLVTKHSQYQSGIAGSQWGFLPAVDTWEHLCVVFSGIASTTSVYRNGILHSASANSNVGASVAANEIVIGARRDLNSVTFWQGMLDDLRLYNRSPSLTEIRLLAIRRGIAYERRKRKQVYFNAAFFNPAWARNSNVILSPVGAA